MTALNNNTVPGQLPNVAPIPGLPMNPGHVERLTITQSYLNAVFNCAECTLLSTAAKITIIAFPLIIALTLIADLVASCFTYENAQIEAAIAPLPADPIVDAVAEPIAEQQAAPIVPEETPKTITPKTVIQVDPVGTAHVLERGVEQIARTLLTPTPPLDEEYVVVEAPKPIAAEEVKIEEVPAAPVFMDYLEDKAEAAAERFLPAALELDAMAPAAVPEVAAEKAPAVKLVVIAAGAEVHVEAKADEIIVREVHGHEPALPVLGLDREQPPQVPAGPDVQLDETEQVVVENFKKWGSFAWSWTKQTYNNRDKIKADVNTFMKGLANKCCKNLTVIDDEADERLDEVVPAPARLLEPEALVEAHAVPAEEKADHAVPTRRARRKKKSITRVDE